MPWNQPSPQWNRWNQNASPWNPGPWGASQPPAPGAFYPRPPLAAEPPREIVIAYALLLLLGTFGLHKFYLRNPGMGGFYLALGIFGWLTSWLLVGFLLLIPLWLMLFLDLFTLPDQVRRANLRY